MIHRISICSNRILPPTGEIQRGRFLYVRVDIRKAERPFVHEAEPPNAEDSPAVEASTLKALFRLWGISGFSDDFLAGLPGIGVKQSVVDMLQTMRAGEKLADQK